MGLVPKTTESSTCTHSRAARTDASCTDRTKNAMAMASVQDVKADKLEGVVRDNEWYTHHVIVKGNRVQIFLNGKLVNDFTEEAGRKAGKDFERKLNEGTIAFQAHDPKSVVHYRNVRVKKH